MNPTAYLVLTPAGAQLLVLTMPEAMALAAAHGGIVRSLVLWADVAHRIRAAGADARAAERLDCNAIIRALNAEIDALRLQLGAIGVT